MLRSRTYEKDGKKVYTTEVVADKVSFLSSNYKSEKQEEPKQQEKGIDKGIEEFSREVDLSVLDNYELPF